MMKKNVTLLITCLLTLMLSLTGCGNNSAEVDDLRQKIVSLEEQVNLLEEKQEVYDSMIAEIQFVNQNAAVSFLKGEVPETEQIIATTEENKNKGENTETYDEKKLQKLMEYLEEQISSNDFDNWLEVAECEYATSEQLLEIAKKCAEIEYYNGYYSKAEEGQQKLADAIISNPAITDEILRQLIKSEYMSIWIKAISSEKCSTITLFEVTNKCVNIDCYEGYYYKAEEGQTILAATILENPVLTDDIVRKLLDSEYPSIWFKALESDKCSEETLIAAAQMCVAIDCYNGYYFKAEEGQLDMAEVILKNPSITENVLKEFAKSEYSSITRLGHQNIETLVMSEPKQ